MKRLSSAFSFFSIAAVLGVPSMVCADTRLEQVAATGSINEDNVSSGRVQLTIIDQSFPLTPSQLRALIKDDREYQTELDIENNTPPAEHKNEQFVFDKKTSTIIKDDTSVERKSTYRIVSTPSAIRSYSHSQQNGDRKLLMVGKPILFPAVTVLPWTCQMWHGLSPTNKLSDPRYTVSDVGNGMLEIHMPSIKAHQLNRTLWVNTKEGNSIVKTEYYNTNSRLPEQVFNVSYRQYDNHIWYPESLTQIKYQNINGSNIQTESISTKVVSVELNPALSDSELEFGDIAAGTFVQDDRFSPPVTYIQGAKQYTDEELFNMSKDPHHTGQPIVIPHKKKAEIGLFVAGISFIVLSIFFLRHNR